MKKVIKIALVAVFAVCSTALYAQKFGRINYSELIQAMPEMDSVSVKMEAATAEYQDHLESLQVELNNKVNDLQKAPATMSESVKQLRQREIQELQERLQQYYQIAQEELGKTEAALYAPIQTKADEAIKKVCKAEGIIVTFQTGAVVYIDEAQTIDILPKVKTELGIQ
ncbi:MAG: OmpH family outer membrane protein [Rikenellaceae bacterium]|jgi:outer membrane protein|nr:OmpH family outer membrane protein [Rikenellaceae bacterium]